VLRIGDFKSERDFDRERERVCVCVWGGGFLRANKGKMKSQKGA